MSAENEVWQELHEHNGREFRLGCRPETTQSRGNFLRASRFPFPLLPRKEWRPIDRRKRFRELGTMNPQDWSNGCVGFSFATLLAKLRVMMGQPFVALSGAYAYSLVNGGSDNGAQISSMLTAGLKMGCATNAAVPLSKANIYRKATSAHDADARRNLLYLAFPIQNFEEFGTTLQMRGLVQFAVRVANNFSRLDSNAVAGFASGPANHSVGADGMTYNEKLDLWLPDVENTWRYDWGDDGRFRWREDYFERTGYQDAFGIVGVVDDRQDAENPPDPV